MIYILIAVIVAVLEGLREGYVYDIDKAGKFPLRDLSKRVKTINGLMYLGLMIALGVLFTEGWIALVLGATMSLTIRWFFLDAVINVYRGFPLFYVGTVASIDVFVREVFGVHFYLGSALLKILFLVFSVTIYFLST